MVRGVVCSIGAALAVGLGAFATSVSAEPTTAPAALPAIKPTGNPGPKPITVPTEKDFAAYLFVFFKDDDHSLHFALSRDGYTFTDVNRGQPIMSGRDLGEQKGIRDPYIARGPDGGFYLGLTDLHIFAKREGLRDTEWERPGELYSWGNNRAIVLMKSFDLVNWTHTIYHPAEFWPAFKDMGCAWAPQMIWDDAKAKMLLSFTTRFGKGSNQLYYTYTDEAFTKFETEPQELFKYPRDRNIIDSDITKVDGKFHLFYVAHDRPGGIRQAVSDRLDGGYVFDETKVDPERVACEAPSVWKRIGTNTYVLMYDVFGVNPHNFGFSETTDFKTFKNIGRFNEGVMKTTNFTSPKHGAIIPITQKEADVLAARWQCSY
ncbi:MAG: glycoside hydrolase family 43 protein [Tepidisphaeraceae bacterium]